MGFGTKCSTNNKRPNLLFARFQSKSWHHALHNIARHKSKSFMLVFWYHLNHIYHLYHNKYWRFWKDFQRSAHATDPATTVSRSFCENFLKALARKFVRKTDSSTRSIWVQKWSKLIDIMTFRHCLYISRPLKLNMNTISCSISLWRLLVYSAPLQVLFLYNRGA